jgi:hypothetical protein
LRFCFNAFSNDVQSHALGQENDHLGNCRVIRIGQDVSHETLVDLELIERKSLQIGDLLALKWQQ